MLRYMYYDEVQLTIDNAPEVLFLARKYLIPSLAEICTEFIAGNLTVANTLPVLDHCCLLGVSNGLEKQCWTIIDQHASEVAQDHQFVEIDHRTLTAFLKRDSLVAKETVLFQAAVRWAGRECQRLSLPLTAENRREVLGDAFYSIRFPLMSMKEFTENVAQSSYLSHEEVANMYIGFNSNFQSCNVKFPTEPRAGLLQEAVFRCTRFESTALRPKWTTVAPQQSTVKFKVSQPISIMGIALFTAVTQSASSSVRVELRDDRDSVLTSHQADLDNRDDDSDTQDVIFSKGIKLQNDVIYSITVTSEETLQRFGQGPMSEINCEGVQFEFFEESGDELETGYIPELLFQPLKEAPSSMDFAEDC